MSTDHVAPQSWERFRYVRRHVPSGLQFVADTGETQGRPLTRREFLELLNRWNSQQPHRWHYWEHVQ